MVNPIPGSLRVSEAYPFPSNPSRVSNLTRNITWSALVIRAPAGTKAEGFFQLPQLPTEAGQKAGSIPILSGQVLFESVSDAE
jgi:hypothetical protein